MNFVEVSDDFAEILFSLVSAVFQEVMGSCGCWRIWTGHCHVVWGWPHGSPGGHTACLAPRGAETGFACVTWSEGRFGLLSWSSGKVQGYPRWCQSCGLYLNIPFSFPSLSTTHFLCPGLLHNTHLITSFLIGPSFATSIPNLSVLIPLPRSFVVLVMQLPWCLARCYSPKGLQNTSPIICEVGPSVPFLTKLPLHHLWNPALLHGAICNFSHFLTFLSIMFSTFSCNVQ